MHAFVFRALNVFIALSPIKQINFYWFLKIKRYATDHLLTFVFNSVTEQYSA